MRTSTKQKQLVTERRVGIRELKSKLSECVREVKAGRTIVVTERGNPVARMVPDAGSALERVEALRKAGKVLWNGQPLPPFQPVAKVRGNRTVADLLIEDRR